MTTKAYLMINVNNKFCRNSYQAMLKDILTMPDIVFIERIDGTCDLLVRSKYPSRIRFLADEILAKEWCENLRILKTGSVEFRENPRITALKLLKDRLAHNRLSVTT